MLGWVKLKMKTSQHQAFGDCWKQEYPAFLSIINDFIKGLKKPSNTFHHVRIDMISFHVFQKQQLSSNIKPAGELIFNFLVSITMSNKFPLLINCPVLASQTDVL